MTRTFALTDATVLVGPDLEPVERATLVVDGGTIRQVGVDLDVRGLATTSLGGRLVMPGFINAHAHVGDASFAEKGFAVSGRDLLYAPHGLRHGWMREASEDDLVEGMRRAQRYMLRCGTVAFADFREQGLPGVQALRRSGEGLPIQASILGRHASYPLHDPSDLEANVGALDADQTAEIEAVLAVADGFSVVSPNDTTDAGLAQTARLVRRAGKGLAAHAAETDEDRQRSIDRTGRSDVVRAVEVLRPDYLVHMTAATPSELELTGRAGIPIVICPRSHAGLGYGVPPFLAAIVAGIEVAIGTDNAMTTSPNVLEEVKFLCRAERLRTGRLSQPTPRQLLAAVTVTPARILGLHSLGFLAPGKQASLIVFDLRSDNLRGVADPCAALVSRAETADIEAVLVAGRIAWGRLGDD